MSDEARFCPSCGSLVSDADGQSAATAAMDQHSFSQMERMLREDTKGEYTIERMLGRGGMAVVYLATEPQLLRKVALKVLPPELTFGHGVERFKREAKTAATMDHPNIIPIYRISSSGNLFWYVMKYLEGQSLDEMMRERDVFTLDETIAILEQVADALDHAHKRQVIHRDIKPANVMFDSRNRVVVTDFGIAKALTEGKLTATDSIIGTPYYMSPEQGMGKPVTGASDQYSVAVMAYRMLAGHMPFDGESSIDILHQHCMFPPPLLADTIEELPRHVSAAVDRGLAKNGEDRFASVHDLVQAMKDPRFRPALAVRPSAATMKLNTPDASKKTRPSSTRTAPPDRTTPRASESVPPRRSSARLGVNVVPTPAPLPRRATPRRAPARIARAAVVIGALVVVAGLGTWRWAGVDPGESTLGDGQQPLSAALVAAPTQFPLADDRSLLPSAAAQLPTADLSTVGSSASAGGSLTSAPDPRPPIASKPDVTPLKKREEARPSSWQVVAAPQSSPMTVPVTPEIQSPPSAEPVAAATAMLTIRFLPPALVTLNAQPYGERSFLEKQVLAGTQNLSVTREGFLRKDTTFTVSAGDNIKFAIKLEPRP